MIIEGLSKEVRGQRWEVRSDLRHGDCIEGMREMEPESVDLVVTSIPFGALFMYSGKSADLGNNQDGIRLDEGQFGLHMRFWIDALLSVVKPGCNVCIHIQQLLRYKNEHGFMGRRDFRGALVELMEDGGFEWKGEIVIPKNPQIIAKRLNLHCLMFITGKTNARNLAPAVNDYVMIFQKPGECAVPVPALRDGTQNPLGEMSTEQWIRDAYGVWGWDDLELKGNLVPGLGSMFEENLKLEGFREAMAWWIEHEDLETGVWTDIRETDVLKNWGDARGSKEEKHICPLQLEVIRRMVNYYSLPGETVYDPFGGIGSTACVANERGRNAITHELKDSYFELSERNVRGYLSTLGMGQADLFAAEASA